MMTASGPTTRMAGQETTRASLNQPPPSITVRTMAVWVESDRGGGLVLGLLLDEGGWFKDARVVSWPAILVVGPDAVIIDSEKSVVKAAQVPDVKDVLDRGY